MARALAIFVSALFLISPMRSFSQTVNFEKIFDDTKVLHSVQLTSDNGYILSGLASEEEEYFAKFIKTDSNCDTLWTKKFPSISSIFQNKTSAIQTSDGGYIFAGSVEISDNIDVFLIKTDAQGEMNWEKTYGDSLEDKSWCLQQTKDHGYLISTFHNTNHAHLIKTDSVGVIEWDWDYGPILSFDRRFQAIQTSDSGYAVIIKSNIFKFDKNGDSLWTRTLDNNFSLIQENDDKSLIMAGNHVLLKSDSLGNDIWLKEGLAITPNILQVTLDGDYVLADDQLLNIDGNGEEQWRVYVDGTIYSLQQTIDGGYAFCGGELTSPFIDKSWFVKTDQNGFYRSLILIRPEEGERIQYSEDYLIAWRQVNMNQINISFSLNNGVEWADLVESYPATSESYSWQIPFLISDECVIRLTAVDQPDLYSENVKPFSILFYQEYDYIAVNQIKMWFSNNGDGSHDPHTDGGGLFWPGGTEASTSAVFEDGLVFAGIIDGNYVAGGNTYLQGLQAGTILENGSAANPDSLIFKIWKIRRDWGVYPPGPEKDRLEHDYQNWPVDLGAPWIDHNGDGVYDPEIDQPKIYGDETNWMVMNDLDSSKTQRLARCDPMGLEIQCTIYGYDRQDALADVVFKKYKIINKNNNFVDDMAFGYWSDTDLGYAADDFMGCDTLLDLTYCYNATNSDEIFGSPPPAVGYLLLKGPIIESEPVDSAWFNEKWKFGYRNLPMTSFSGYI